VRRLEQSRLGRRIGTGSEEEMRAIERALRVAFDLV